MFDTLNRDKTGVPIHVFTDADITERSDEVEKALRDSKVLFCSLIFDFIQMQWIKERSVIYFYSFLYIAISFFNNELYILVGFMIYPYVSSSNQL